MRMRTSAVALLGIVVLAVSGCASTITGTAQAQPGVTVAQTPSGDGDLGDLSDLGAEDVDDLFGDMGDLFEGLAGGDAGDISGLLEGLSGDDMGDIEGMEDFAQLFEGLASGEMGDLGELFDTLSGGEFGELAEGMPDASTMSDCLSLASMYISLGTVMMGPSMGQPLTQESVDRTFGNIKNVPDELVEPLAVMHDEMSAAVGKKGQDAIDAMESPRIQAAMDAIDEYGDTYCD